MSELVAAPLPEPERGRRVASADAGERVPEVEQSVAYRVHDLVLALDPPVNAQHGGAEDGARFSSKSWA